MQCDDTPKQDQSQARLIHGDCREAMKLLGDNSVDSIVTDPPYELGFMRKCWDSGGVAYDVSLWKEALRVLKPGGHLLAFGGSRTYHRLACAIEDAGFEIRDQIMWLYGSGFPKSLDVSKAIDKYRRRDYVLAGFPFTSSNSGTAFKSKKAGQNTYGKYNSHEYEGFYGDSGSAARFYYCAKASKAVRGENNTHPTVKPTELMRYLCRLVTPPGGIVLDPFTGSGSTGKAALLEGFRFIGIEREAEYYAIAQARLAAVNPSVETSFGDSEPLSMPRAPIVEELPLFAPLAAL